MKKRQLIILFLSLPLFFLLACIFMGPAIRGEGEVTEETRKIKDFEKIEVSRGLEIFLVPDSQEYVMVEADENLHDVILTEVKNGTLEVYTRKFIRSAQSRKVYVHYVHLRGIKSTSGAMVQSQGPVHSKKLEISASSGSSQILEVSAGQFEGRCSSGAQIELKGKAGKAMLKASSGAQLRGNDFMASECHAKSSSGAHIWTGVKDKLVAEASSGGHIYYSGNPATTSFDSSSGGLIQGE
jgi:hypothetical protein